MRVNSKDNSGKTQLDNQIGCINKESENECVGTKDVETVTTKTG